MRRVIWENALYLRNSCPGGLGGARGHIVPPAIVQVWTQDVRGGAVRIVIMRHRFECRTSRE